MFRAGACCIWRTYQISLYHLFCLYKPHNLSPTFFTKVYSQSRVTNLFQAVQTPGLFLLPFVPSPSHLALIASALSTVLTAAHLVTHLITSRIRSWLHLRGYPSAARHFNGLCFTRVEFNRPASSGRTPDSPISAHELLFGTLGSLSRSARCLIQKTTDLW